MYLRSNLAYALSIVVVFAVVSNIASAIVTENMAQVLGYGTADILGLLAEGFFGVVVSILSLLVFSVVAAVASREVFAGKGDRGATITLVSYCYPWVVLLTIVMLTIFSLGFEGLGLERVQQWADAEIERAIMFGAILLAVAVIGFAWLIWLVSKAIGIANDVRTGQAVLCAIVSAVAAGVVSLFAGMVIRLPIGISL